MGHNRYLEEFFSLQCAGDVINAVTPLTRATKEITEAMGVVRHLKTFFLGRMRPWTLSPMGDVDLVDIGAGNALASILAVHLLPVHHALAVDKKKRDRPGYANVQRFCYIESDVFLPKWVDENPLVPSRTSVIVAVHSCGQLATRIIDIYHSRPWYIGLVLMPCCNGPQNDKKIPTAFRQRISKYEAWAWWLAERAKGDLFVDRNVLSPCNAIVVAKKGKEEASGNSRALPEGYGHTKQGHALHPS